MSKKPTPKITNVADQADAVELTSLPGLPMRNGDAKCEAPRADVQMKTVENGTALFSATGRNFLVVANHGTVKATVTVEHGVRTAKGAVKRMPIKDYDVGPGVISVLGPFDPDGFVNTAGLVIVVVDGDLSMGVFAA